MDELTAVRLEEWAQHVWPRGYVLIYNTNQDHWPPNPHRIKAFKCRELDASLWRQMPTDYAWYTMYTALKHPDPARRKVEDVSGGRVLWADVDEKDKRDWRKLRPEPSFVIRTSEFGFHAGWLVEWLDRERLEGFNRALQRALGTDPVYRGNRWMRAPLGVNLKARYGMPHPRVELVHASYREYRTDRLAIELPPPTEQPELRQVDPQLGQAVGSVGVMGSTLLPTDPAAIRAIDAKYHLRDQAIIWSLLTEDVAGDCRCRLSGDRCMPPLFAGDKIGHKRHRAEWHAVWRMTWLGMSLEEILLRWQVSPNYKWDKDSNHRPEDGLTHITHAYNRARSMMDQATSESERLNARIKERMQ